MAKTTKLLTKAQRLRQKVDELGELCARMSDLKVEADDIKLWLKKTYGKGSYEGDLFRATVSIFDKDYLDMDAVRAKLSPQFLKAHTTTKEESRVLCVARNAKNLGNKKAA